MPVRIVKGGTLIDGTGREPLEKAVIVIEGSKIAAVGREGEISVPGSNEVIDAAGKTIMPGLVDLHVHLSGIATAEAPKMAKDTYLRHLTASDGLKLVYATKHAWETLEAGFTTVRDCGFTSLHHGEELVPLREAIMNDAIPGPRLIVYGWVSMTAGHADMAFSSVFSRRTEDVADGPWECRKRVREFVRNGVDGIKTSSGGGVWGYGEERWWRNYTIEELTAIADEAHSFGKKVSAHCYTSSQVRNAARAGIDTMEHGTDMDQETINLILDKGLFYVPTLLTFSDRTIALDIAQGTPEWQISKLREAQEEAEGTFRKAHKAGVKIAFGNDMWNHLPHGQNAYGLELYVKAGQSEMEAILSATRIAAEALGLQDSLGTIEKGKIADMVVVDGDPLRDIKILQEKSKLVVIKEGRTIAVNGRHLHGIENA